MFYEMFTHFLDFKSNWSSDFGHAETVRREIFSLLF